jgi:hypothetical protein
MPRIVLPLEAKCPRCGTRPSIRVYLEQAARFRTEPPTELVLEVVCQRRLCREIYDIPAKAFQAGPLTQNVFGVT